MEFGSVAFILRFLPIFFILYFVVPGRMKNVILLLGSLCFYAWGKPILVIPMIVSAISDFIFGLRIEKHRGKSSAKILLFSALFFDMGLLFFFGYADFFVETANSLLGTGVGKLGFPAPVGITVYTLQTMSYVIDVYRGNCKAARNILEYGTFVTMFPQLPAGPILKYRDMQASLHQRKMDLSMIATGTKRFCVGLTKKVLVADAAMQLWNMILEGKPGGMSIATAWLGMAAFGFAIYFTYSGYCDIAIGLAGTMGFSFPENYDHPYSATTVTEFLRRWNLTLTKWMKEYFFRPLTDGKKNVFLRILVLVATWGLIGFWYGPDWTFVLWGVWLVLFYVLEKLFLGKLISLLPRVVGWCYVMLVVAIGWLLFALDDVKDAWAYLQAMLGMDCSGLIDNRFWFLVREYLPTLLLGTLFCLPFIGRMLRRVETGKSGMAIAIKRLLEKVYPAVFLLASLVYLVGRGW
ncbi:MAG: MBOAT family protein [Lachnospiraceae bacterium]|nr:MBOAT family protein [Lachnospiraceae bacterium]